MDLSDDEHLDVCQNIEAHLRRQYDLNPELTDSLCVLALDNAKIEVKKQFGYAKNERIVEHPFAKDIIDGCVQIGLERIGKINDLTLAEYVKRIEKIKRSVIRHSAYGTRAYYEFIRNYV